MHIKQTVVVSDSEKAADKIILTPSNRNLLPRSLAIRFSEPATGDITFGFVRDQREWPLRVYTAAAATTVVLDLELDNGAPVLIEGGKDAFYINVPARCVCAITCLVEDL